MRRLAILSLLLSLAGINGGCALTHRAAPAPARPPATASTAADGPAIERIPFRIGVSSATVEHLAGAAACTSAQGAGLITAEGPVEIYRVQCDNGKIFLARCELRQCTPMPAAPR